MLSRSVGAMLSLAVAAGSALAEQVTSNRGVACQLRTNAAALHALTARKDHAEWAKRSGALIAAGQCILLLQGTAVTLAAPAADGVAEIEAKGQAGPLWIEAASVGFPVPPILPDEMGERRNAPSGSLYGCAALGTVADARRLIVEDDLPAHRELIRREVDAGRCRLFPAGAEVIWQRRERGGVAIVREVGKPDKLWIDEDLWLIEAQEAKKAVVGKP